MSDPSAGLAALADPIRRRLLDVLSEAGGRTASELVESFDISRQAIVKHLNQLEQAGLVVRATRGRAVVFSLQPAALSATAQWLDSTTRRWNDRLDRLAAQAETNQTTTRETL